MFKKIVFFVYLLLSFPFFSRVALAGNCFPEPSPNYLSYLNGAKIIVLLFAFVLLFFINFLLISLIFKRYQNIIKNKRLIIFSFLITILSFIFYGFIYYWFVLPNAGVQSLSGGIQGGILSSKPPLIFLIFMFVFPTNIISFIASYFSSNFLLKKLVKITSYTKRTILLVSLVMLPVLGILITLFLSKMYFQLFPFIGQAWLPCIK